MDVAFRVASTTLDGIQTAVTGALADFFGTTEYTYSMLYVQGDQDFTTDGWPVRYQADVQATTDISPAAS
jgi:hypothetical protein